MRLVSVNAEKTIGPKQIAFNVDEDLTQDFISRISYGALRFHGQGKVLVVQLPVDSDLPFSEASVETLNHKLAEVKSALDAIANRRRRMLEDIAEQAGLGLE